MIAEKNEFIMHIQLLWLRSRFLVKGLSSYHYYKFRNQEQYRQSQGNFQKRIIWAYTEAILICTECYLPPAN